MPDHIPVADQPGRLAAGCAATTSGDAWDTGMRRWDLFYGLAFAATLGLVETTTGQAGRIVATAALLLMVPWYLLVGRAQMRDGDGSVSRRTVVYLVGVVLLFGVAASVAPNSWFLAIALCPQCYHLLPARRALLPVTALTLVGALSVGYQERGSTVGLFAAACTAVGVIAFSVAFSGYIIRIIEQSRERASLIGQLEATRAELSAVSRQAGALAERQRLAGEIHDTLAQGFSSILMLVQAADAQLENSPATARGQLALAAQTARENLTEARSLVGGLVSAQLQAGTLEDALRRITERTGAELSISASFEVSGAGRALPPATEVVLLRTGQEALANVRKHAAARSVSVRLCYADSGVRLEVADDGVGFDPASVNGGYGLRGMRGRVSEAGGTLAVRSSPLQGTRVLVEVPA